MDHVQLAVECHNQLGEGPLWDPRSNTLFWVDIERAELHSFLPRTHSHLVVHLPIAFTALGLRKAGGLVVATRNGFGYFDTEEGRYEPLQQVLKDNPDSRFNDGAVDPAGNFWAGTYSKSHQPSGFLYRFDKDKQLHEIQPEIINSNGLGWSPDQIIMYHTDTRRWTIFAYDFDPSTGGVTNRRPFIEVPDKPGEGVPDGLTVDQEGYIWSARYYGGKIVRYTPTGEIDREVQVPAKNVTSCTFGGEDLCTLFITTAASEADENHQGGNLFFLDAGVCGMPKNFFQG